METNSVTGQSVTANPLPASKNELISSHTTAVEQEQEKTSHNVTQKVGFIPFFFNIFLFLERFQLKLSIYPQGTVWF